MGANHDRTGKPGRKFNAEFAARGVVERRVHAELGIRLPFGFAIFERRRRTGELTLAFDQKFDSN